MFDTIRTYFYVDFMLIKIQSEVGWRVKGQSRRIVLAITDGDYHYALDGKVNVQWWFFP